MKYEAFDEWRKIKRIKTKDLARAAGVNTVSLSYYRSKNRPFPADWIAAWANYFFIPRNKIGELFFEGMGVEEDIWGKY